MPDISIRYENNIVVLNEDRVVRGYFSVDTVEVLLSNSSICRLLYKGVTNYEQNPLLPVQYVKLINIVAYHSKTFNLSMPIDIPKDHYCVGLYENDGVYLVLDEGKPMVYSL
ncbi:hypothetical protein ACPV5G_20340 [Photobacterium damselae]|uniref:hypothetical protein n=1 Tax=Photobacterium damselae TaxID=38293 RepID=UPI0040692613